MDLRKWEHLLREAFPNLEKEGFEIVEVPSRRYNCIAYAAGDIANWWEPTRGRYWPLHATRSDSIESLRDVFVGLGFEQCEDSDAEDGYRKIVLYEAQGTGKHAAVQLSSGRWHSKMGQGPVVEHTSPESLSGGIYGNPTMYMRRVVNESNQK